MRLNLVAPYRTIQTPNLKMQENAKEGIDIKLNENFRSFNSILLGD